MITWKSFGSWPEKMRPIRLLSSGLMNVWRWQFVIDRLILNQVFRNEKKVSPINFWPLYYNSNIPIVIIIIITSKSCRKQRIQSLFLSLSLSPPLPIISRSWKIFFAAFCVHTSKQILVGRPILVCPCVRVHKRMSLISSSLLLQHCPAYLFCLSYIF